MVAAGSGLMPTLVVHCASHWASVLLDITRLPVSYILYPFNADVLFFICHHLCLPRAGVETSTEARAVSAIFIYVSSALSREPGTQKVLKTILY